MKWTFAMKLFEVIFVLWCCVVTNAQNSEPFGNISTSFVHPSPTAVVSTMNASKTSPSSQITLVKGQTSVPHLHSSVKEARTINSTMTIIPTTVHSTTGPMKDGGSNLALILSYVTVAAGLGVIVVWILVVLYKYQGCYMPSSVQRLPEYNTMYMRIGHTNTIGEYSDVYGEYSDVYVTNSTIMGPDSDDDVHPVITGKFTAPRRSGDRTFPVLDTEDNGILEFEEDDTVAKFTAPRRSGDRTFPVLDTEDNGILEFEEDDTVATFTAPRRFGARTFPVLDTEDSGIIFREFEEDDTVAETVKPEIAKWKFITPQSLMCPGPVKKIITADGGVIANEDIILKLGPGCLAKDTEITLRNSDKGIAIKSLLDSGLVDVAPRVVEFLPDGLKFLKPADLTITFQNTVSNTKLFVLHGSYNPIYKKTVWELVTNDIKELNAKGVCNTKINSFCFYMFILATRGMLARILSHLNHSFTCRAYTLYRRLSTMDTIDISVVLLSEFVDDDKGEDIKQLNDHLDLGYVKGEKGLLKRVHTDRRLEMSLHFPGVESIPFSFIVDQPQLDSVGFVIDHFQEIAVKSPASGKVKISDVQRRDENESLWRMSICEMEEQIRVEEAEVQYSAPNPEPEVVYSNTKLTKGEITRMSCMVGLDWDSLAGLMNIPYSEREEIRVDCGNYLSISSKAKKVFELFNDSTFFDRHILIKYFQELGRHDLEKKMLPVDQNGSEEVETSPTPPVLIEEDLLHTPLSPREISRLGRRIVVEWDHLAGLMDIPRAERDDIRYSFIYNDNRSRAEKILTIFNNKEDFSREKLARCLEEIHQLDLMKPVITGEWINF